MTGFPGRNRRKGLVEIQPYRGDGGGIPKVNLGFDKALLYKIWLRPALTGCMSWKSGTIFLMRRREKRFTKEQKSSTTIVKDKRFIPMIPVPAAAKKYKKCCGKNK